MNTLATYLENISQLRKEMLYVNEKKIRDYGLLGTYKVVSANLSLFLPSVKREKHLNLIKNIHLNRSIAIIDQEFLFLLDNLKIIDKNAILSMCKEKSYIFSTYHTGSYRLLIALFAKLNLKFCLVTERNFINTQGNYVKALYKKVKSKMLHEENSEKLEILNAENPSLILKIAHKIKDKYSIVFYIDGNTGTNDFSIAKEKLLNIKFLDSFIMARKGIGYISHLTKTPIISVIGKRISDIENELSFEMIENNSFLEDRDVYVRFTTKKLFSILENFILLYPEQWEGWFYIQKFIDKHNNILTKNATNTSLNMHDILNKKVKFNSTVYDPIEYNETDYFLINRKKYSVSKITPELFKIIDYFSKPRIITDTKQIIINNNIILEENAFKELFLLNILTPEIN